MLGTRKALCMGFMALLLLLATKAFASSYYFAPTNGNITSPFGWRFDPFTGGQRFHGGVDIAAASGTPVYATQAGLVTFSGYYGGYGNIVVLNHGNTLYTLYGHNARLLVQPGQPVYRGQIVALVGSTGRSTGPHLHFEVHYRQQYVNPMTYLGYLQQQSPTLAIAAPVTSIAKKETAAKNTQKAGTTSKKKPKQAKRVTSRRTYNATVQLVNGTKIQNVRL